ncbi:MAG: N-acetylglucosamine-6-phosphate deacetylase [Propionibacteriales bacterium]|nr:N-acetylglucosamine-6-phosphate deacetylase [Propionibacteriales bacterium]
MAERELLRGRVVTPDGVIPDGVVQIDGDRIAAVSPVEEWRRRLGTPQGDTGGGGLPESRGVLLPGLVDLHCHGGGGHSFTDGDPDALLAGAAHHLAHGTTTLIASLVTAAPDDLLEATAAAAELAGAGVFAGVHLEGPYLSARRCGAQDPRHVRAPDPAETRRLLAAAGGRVRVMTIAPELPAYADVAGLLHDESVLVALGHTDADHRTTAHAIARVNHRSGPALATHLFNAMPPLHHRAPGPAGAFLTAAARGGAVVELIADGVHLSDATVELVCGLVGADRIALVTDAMAGAGMPNGSYTLGAQEVEVNGGVARLAGTDEGSIAGGTARSIDLVRRCVREIGLDIADVVRMAATTPARVLGLDGEIGGLRAGLRADVVVADEDLRPVAVMRAGRWVGP